MSRESSIQGYWRVYGGLYSLATSKYILLALLLNALFYPMWIEKIGNNWPWVELANAIVPSLLGFSLGGMSIMLAFSSGKFLEAVRQGGKPDSYFMQTMARFYHFALTLVASLLFSFFLVFGPDIGRLETVLSFIGCLLLIYGLLLVIAILSSIWHTARIFNSVKHDV